LLLNPDIVGKGLGSLGEQFAGQPELKLGLEGGDFLGHPLQELLPLNGIGFAAHGTPFGCSRSRLKFAAKKTATAENAGKRLSERAIHQESGTIEGFGSHVGSGVGLNFLFAALPTG
jgi:hypothetical protein